MFQMFSNDFSHIFPSKIMKNNAFCRRTQEILAAVRSGAMPSVMPARAGSALQPPHRGGFTLPARVEPQRTRTRGPVIQLSIPLVVTTR